MVESVMLTYSVQGRLVTPQPQVFRHTQESQRTLRRVFVVLEPLQALAEPVVAVALPVVVCLVAQVKTQHQHKQAEVAVEVAYMVVVVVEKPQYQPFQAVVVVVVVLVSSLCLVGLLLCGQFSQDLRQNLLSLFPVFTDFLCSHTLPHWFLLADGVSA